MDGVVLSIVLKAGIDFGGNRFNKFYKRLGRLSLFIYSTVVKGYILFLG